ncbi:MAG TPA: hypothetical protein VGX46_15330 [Vicinamibacterales bacterium]|jgi:hypothetical protein|nr:hypothetical protein [Vicinamibacterales bacterium]
MAFRIDTRSDGHCTTIRLIGQFRAEHLPDLAAQIRTGCSRIVLDLEEITLVDVEAIRFLRDRQTEGLVLSNCSSYITTWIAKERSSGT